MFTLENAKPNGARLISRAALSREHFDAIGRQLGTQPFSARKTALVTARECRATEQIATQWNGTETVNDARPGDYIVTSLDTSGVPMVDSQGHQNIYVITADKFGTLYQAVGAGAESEKIYRARQTIRALELAGGFEIMAPWGELQRADRGYLVQNGQDIYGNNKETFEATYERTAT